MQNALEEDIVCLEGTSTVRRTGFVLTRRQYNEERGTSTGRSCITFDNVMVAK